MAIQDLSLWTDTSQAGSGQEPTASLTIED